MTEPTPPDERLEPIRQSFDTIAEAYARFATLAEAACLVIATVQARAPYDFEWATRRIYLEADA